MSAFPVRSGVWSCNVCQYQAARPHLFFRFLFGGVLSATLEISVSGFSRSFKKSLWDLTSFLGAEFPGILILLIVYLFMAVTSIGVYKNGQNLKKIPSFIVKNGQQKPPQNRGGFCCVFWFLLSQCLCHFLLVSPYFLLFHDILEPQNSPPNEVTGLFIYFSL